jgi:Adenylate cyclase, family 3 (some proteins contain HAMP domain)
MAYRFGVAGGLVVAALATLLPWAGMKRFYRAPLATSGLVVGYFQALSMTWAEEVPYAYAVVIPALACLLLRCGPAKSAAYLAVAYGLQLGPWQRSGVGMEYMVSGAALAFCFTVAWRGAVVGEIRQFILGRERERSSEELLKLQRDMNRELRAFLPRALYTRVVTRWQAERMTPLEAIEEELTPRLATAVFIFTDIRGFTARASDLEGYLFREALPNIRMCVETIESLGGHPRVIGDAVFAYFDGAHTKCLLARALHCAFALVEESSKWNGRRPAARAVRRFVLLGMGEAIVGNVGGRNSSREITALGPPVNLLARLDALTKEEAAAGRFDPGKVILSHRAGQAADFCFPGVCLQMVSLEELGLEVRDFPNEKILWLAAPTGRNRRAIGF